MLRITDEIFQNKGVPHFMGADDRLLVGPGLDLFSDLLMKLGRSYLCLLGLLSS